MTSDEITRRSAGEARAAGVHDFAFQTGRWAVRHRKLGTRLAGASDWYAFEGACDAWEILDGAGNLDDHLLDDPAGAYRAASLRRYDPASGLWSIWWWDTRLSDVGPPVRGRFSDGVGVFSGRDVFGGRPIEVRYTWSEVTPSSARWEQAFSLDGRAWETNWIMLFERRP